MSALRTMLERFAVPPVAKAVQRFDDTTLADPRAKLERLLAEKPVAIAPGARIAITAGSRGIAEYTTVMKTLVDFVKAKGGKPFLVPSMGSHGGGTAEGQTRLLRNLGISEETMGAPVVSSMEVSEIGKTELGIPVYIDKNALEADGIILFNRVKTHTSIREIYQSGLVKMLAIGLAKHKGAVMTHSTGVPNLGPNMVMTGKYALARLNIVCGVSTIENGYGALADLYVSLRDEILDSEPDILKRAIAMLPRIQLPGVDCLIVRDMGKDISGTGMDPAVIGRPINRRANEGPAVETLGVLRLTPKSDGNASGCGMADFIPRRLRDAIDEQATMVNSLTGMHPEIARIPATVDTDKLVFQGCLFSCGQIHPGRVRLAVVRNTKALDEIYLTRAAADSIEDPGRISVVSDYGEVPFDAEGRLLLFHD